MWGRPGKGMDIKRGQDGAAGGVENAIAQCYGVIECAVVGMPDPQWGERGVAVVALQEGAAHHAETLVAELRTRLAGYKIPAEFHFVSALPKTGADKIDRAAVRRQVERGVVGVELDAVG